MLLRSRNVLPQEMKRLSLRTERRQTFDESWSTIPDRIDHGPDVSPSQSEVFLPVRHHFMYVQDRLIPLTAELVEERNISPILFSQKLLVITPHGNHEIRRFDHLAGYLTLDMK